MNEDGQKGYIIDAESGAETARLIDQDRLLTRGMGGVLPEQADLSNIAAVLDLGCGPGGWAQDMALTYPQMEVTGIDISRTMITYAKTMAKVRGLNNVRFEVMNVLQGLDFPDEAFDLVNIRFIASFMNPTTWVPLLKECRRILQPGGILRVTENDWISYVNNSTGYKLGQMSLEAMRRSGRSYGIGEWNGVIIPYIMQFFHEAGFPQVQKRAHVIDYSFGMAAHEHFYQDWLVVSKLMQPFLCSMQVATTDELEQLREQFLSEMQEERFCGLFHYFTLWSSNPE